MGFIKNALGLNNPADAIKKGSFKDPTLAKNKARLEERIGGLGQNEFRDKELSLANALEAQASGTAPSIAEQQLKQGFQQGLEAQIASAAAQRGGNAALTQRTLAQQIARQGQELGGQAAVARMQEQQQAQQNLASVLAQGRGADAQREGLVQQYLQMGLNLDQAQFQANMDLQKMKLQGAELSLIHI